MFVNPAPIMTTSLVAFGSFVLRWAIGLIVLLGLPVAASAQSGSSASASAASAEWAGLEVLLRSSPPRSSSPRERLQFTDQRNQEYWRRGQEFLEKHPTDPLRWRV